MAPIRVYPGVGGILEGMMIATRKANPETARNSPIRGFLLGAALAAFAGTLGAAAPLPAQPLVGPNSGQDRGPVQRIVHGKVENKSGEGIKGAVVYLKDDRSSAVKSAISEDDGSYRFVQLSLNTDYELWAQSDSKKSPTKSISSFDSKADITIMLKIDM
jgi:hypothetical protein